MTVWSLVDKSVSYIKYPKDCQQGIDFTSNGKYMALAERRDCKDCLSVFTCNTWQLLKVCIMTPLPPLIFLFFYLHMCRRHILLMYLLLLFDAAEQQSNKLCRSQFCSATNKNSFPSFNQIRKQIYLFIILITSFYWHFSGCPLIDQVGSWGHNSELVWWLMIWLSTNKFCCTSCILLIAALWSWDRRFSGCPLVSWWWSALCVGV
mgnify:CR=1 FL=1